VLGRHQGDVVTAPDVPIEITPKGPGTENRIFSPSWDPTGFPEGLRSATHLKQLPPNRDGGSLAFWPRVFYAFPRPASPWRQKAQDLERWQSACGFWSKAT